MERFGPADFNGAIQGTAACNLRDRTRDVVSSKGLDPYGRYPNGGAAGRGLGNACQELEELGGLDDGVRDRRVSDQLLLRKLRAKITASLQTLGAHH